MHTFISDDQPQKVDVTVQPGSDHSDDHKNEGIGNKKVSKYGDYECTFRSNDNALFIMMKNTKTKREFSNTFSKSALISMNLNQPIAQVVGLLQLAKSGSKKEFQFAIGYGNANNNKKVSFNQLLQTFRKGYSLYICITIKETWFTAEYNFKLLEKQRDEIDILRELIVDMQQEINILKNNKPVGPALAVWKINNDANVNNNNNKTDDIDGNDLLDYSYNSPNSYYSKKSGKRKSKSNNNYARYNNNNNNNNNIPQGNASMNNNNNDNIAFFSFEHIAPTLKGMVTVSNDKKNISILLGGLYRVKVVLLWNNMNGCTTDCIKLKVNNQIVAMKSSGVRNGPGTIDEIYLLKKGDSLAVDCPCFHTTNGATNSFTLIKL